jgi:hypothetical protein
MVAGALLGATVFSSIALADIPDSGVFHGCVKKHDDDERVLRVIDASDGQTYRRNEAAVSWNATGPTGPAGPAGPQGPAGPPGAAGGGTIFLNRNFQDVSIGAFPGATVAHLDLGPGTYVLQAKFRYRNDGATRQTGACLFQGAGIGGLDGSQQNVDGGGELNGQADGTLLDIVIKRPGDATDVHLQCFGPGDGSMHIVNSELMATLPGTLSLR